jgi:hypothetical protein
MVHELRIAKPTIRHDHGWGQLDAAPAKGCQAPIQHILQPPEFIAARSPRALGVRPTDGKIHGHHQFPLANDDHQEDSINP